MKLTTAAGALIIGVLGCSSLLVESAVNPQTEVCSNGIDQTLYADDISYTVADWSWAKPRNFTNCSPVHSGVHSISFVPKTYDGIYFSLQNPIDPSVISHVSLWLHGNKGGNQKVLVRFTLNKVAVSRDFFLWGANSCIVDGGNIKAGKWVNAIINTDNLEPGQYDGVQILAQNEEVQEMIFIDDIEVHKRCMFTNPYRNTMKPTHCDGHDCVTIMVREGEKNWIANGIEYQEYTVTFKNTNTAAVNILEFKGGWFKPRDTKDIWNISYLDGGFYGLPANINALYPGQEYSFGCVSVKGPVTFKVSYVEYENEKALHAGKQTVSKPKATIKPATTSSTGHSMPTKPTTTGHTMPSTTTGRPMSSTSGMASTTTGHTMPSTTTTGKPTQSPKSPASKSH